LHLNRTPLVAYRRERLLRQSAEKTQQSLLQRLKHAEDRIRELSEQLERLKYPEADA